MNTRIYYLALVIYIFLSVGCFNKKTDNITSFSDSLKQSNKIKPPVFSKKPGFYPDNILLEIKNPNKNGTIYYTFDGSTPLLKGNENKTYKYIEPLVINEKTNLNSDSFNRKLRNGNLRKVRMPKSDKVFKGTILKAVIVIDDKQSKIETSTFFVNMTGETSYNFRIASLSLDRSSLFDDNSGIYVKGKNVNYNKSGKDWERRASVEMFEKNGELFFSQDAGIRINGGYTRGFPQKSLRLYSRKKFGGNYFKYSFFGDRGLDKYKSLILRNSGNDWNQLMFRDSLAQNLVSHLNIETQSPEPMVVFINGEYWGIHNLRERYDKFYFANKYNIPEDKVVILKNNGIIDEGVTGDEKHYHDMIEFIRNNDLSKDENYRKIESLMDIENFILYFVIQIYYGNTDWPQNNIKFWRYRTAPIKDKVNTHADGRWRWILYDLDRSLGYTSYKHNTLAWVTSELCGKNSKYEWPNFLFRQLLKNDEFTNKFLTTLSEQLNTTFNADRINIMIDKYKDIYASEIDKHFDRWPPVTFKLQIKNIIKNREWLTAKKLWLNYINEMKEFAEKRPDILRSYVSEYFNIETVSLLSSGFNSGGEIESMNSVVFERQNGGNFIE